ncbi:hypothetical protein AgCh_020246 [Apium graveolens]
MECRSGAWRWPRIKATNERESGSDSQKADSCSRSTKKYADQSRKDVLFEPGDKVLLKISPWKGLTRFGKKGKLSPRYIGPFEVLRQVGKVAYELALPPHMQHLHNVFHVSLLKKYNVDASHVIELEPIEIQQDLFYVEQPVQILDRKEKTLRNKVVPLVRVLWRNPKIEESTWELESEMREKPRIKATNERESGSDSQKADSCSRSTKKYADQSRKDVLFEPGDKVLLKISPWKGLTRFGKKGKLSPRYIGPFEVLRQVGKVAYELALPPHMQHLHNVFHVSLLKKYNVDASHVIELEPIEIQQDLFYVEQPVQILDRKEKTLRNKVVPLVRVLWRNPKIEESTWELESEMREKYPHLFV